MLWDPELERRSGGPSVSHRFLHLQQPFEPPNLKETTLQPTTTHLFSFAFVLPAELSAQSCHHPCRSPHVHDCHRRLPPSFPVRGPQAKLDPSRVTISYLVRFKAMAVHPSSRQDLYRIDRSHDVVVSQQPQPQPQQPPAVVPDPVWNEVVLRDLGRRMGRLTASAGEPKPIQLDQRTTLLPIQFTFAPSSGDRLPPRPHKAHTRLEATTYFGTKPYTSLPDQPEASSDTGGKQQRAFRRQVALSSRDIHVHWTQKTPGSATTAYTASVALPVILPGAVVPSFYSCLVARVYALDVEVSFHSHLPGSSTVSLRVPVHVV